LLWDLWTHPRYGLGLPESRLNVTELDAVAQTLVTEGMGVSPVITRPMTYRELLVRLCECFDGYGTGMGVSVNWDPSDPRRNAEGPTETLTPAISRTVVELLTVGGVLKQTFAFSATGPQTITNAQIIAALGAESDVVLRAWFESAGRRSLESDQVTVRKV
jgi:hypothetical protein